MIKRQSDAMQTDTAFMRLCATFFVILIHASGVDSLSAIVANSVSRFSVPVFIMLSGYYMLPRKPDGKRLAKKCCRLFGLMVIWSGIYFIYNMLSNSYSWSGLSDLLRYLLTEPIHLWYVYAAIALYVFTPLLHVFHSNASQREYIYALALTFFFGSCVVVLVRTEVFPILPVILEQAKLPYALGFAFLYLLGGYLQKYTIVQLSHRVWLYLAGLVGVAITIVGTWIFPSFGLPQDLLLSFFAPNVIVPAAAFFVLVQQFFHAHQVKSLKTKNAIHLAAQCSMGIYFLHPLILAILRATADPYLIPSVPCVFIALRTLIAWVVSMAIVFVGKRTPVLKWLF